MSKKYMVGANFFDLIIMLNSLDCVTQLFLHIDNITTTQNKDTIDWHFPKSVLSQHRSFFLSSVQHMWTHADYDRPVRCGLTNSINTQ